MNEGDRLRQQANRIEAKYQALIKEFDRRPRFLVPEVAVRRYYAFFSLYGKWFYRAMGGLAALVVLWPDYPNRWGTLTRLLLLQIALLLFTQTATIRSEKGPERGRNLDKWLWIRGRQATFLQMWAVVMTLFAFAVPSRLDVAYITGDLLIFIGYFCYLLYLACILLVLRKPHLFVSNWFNGLGVAGYVGMFIFAGRGFLQRFLPPTGQTVSESLFPWILTGSLVFVWIVFGLLRNTQITLLQAAVLRIIEPDRLLHVFKNQARLRVDQIEALKVLERLERTGQYGVKLALAQELAQNSGSSKSRIVLWAFGIFSIFLFVVSKLVDQLIPDLAIGLGLYDWLCQLWWPFSVLCE